MPWGTRRGGGNLWRGWGGSGGPVGAGLGNFHKAGTQREGWLAGVVADRQHLVAERWHQQQVDVLEDARHFFRDFAAETIGLHEIDGGEKAGLAEEVGPGIGGL